MVWGIIGAMDSEIQLLLQNMTGTQSTFMKGAQYHTGTLHGHEVVVAGCGIGKVNAAVCAQRLIDKYEVDCILHTGIAGGMDKRLHILDVVVSQTVVCHDAHNDIIKKYPPYEVEFEADSRLIEWSVEAVKKACPQDTQCYTGRIVSGDQFITDSGVKTEIAQRMQPMCVEMEGAAVGQTAFINDIPFVVIRTISDNADDQGAMDYNQFEEQAAKRSAGVVMELLKHSLT